MGSVLGSLGQVDYKDCEGRYIAVASIVEKIADSPAKQVLLYELLSHHGGTCDCTVDRNIVRQPSVLAAVEADIKKISLGTNS